MADKRTDDELDRIWKCIEDGKYKEAIQKATDFLPGPIIGPERLFSDEGGDCMSIPNNDGTHRDIYRRKSNSKQWEII
jgi:hypothetical protein